MRTFIRVKNGARLALAVAVAAASVDAQAQDPAGDVAAGHRLAREVCRACHVVDPGAQGGRTTGPAFGDIANTPGMTAMALQAFLMSPHAKMPNLILTRSEARDVIAYILSLQGQH